MADVGRVLVMLAGAWGAIYVLTSAIRTVVVPRAEPVVLTRAVFVALRRVFELRLRRARTYEDRDRLMAFYGPLALVLLPGMWVAVLIGAFTAVHWGMGLDPLSRSFEVAGSSLLTLGFDRPDTVPAHAVSYVAATLGLGVVALVISYLPSIYASFQRRELLVAELTARAGEPPFAIDMIVRHHQLDRLDALDDLWDEWARWFADIEETHTSQPSLVWFRSISHERSWITAAGVVLDAGALRAAALDLPRNPQAELCVRGGYLALRRIADYYGIEFDRDPAPGDPISVERAEFDAAYDQMAAEGVPLRRDRDQAWRDFAGWRVNYDVPLLALAGMIMAPYAQWSSDRSPRYRRRPLTARGRRRRALEPG